MATIIFILIILAGYHVVCENVIAPEVRQLIRYRLFALRDRLIELKLDSNNQIPDKAFDLIHQNLNLSIKFLPFLNFSALYTGIAFSRIPTVAAETKKASDMIAQCNVPELQYIVKKRNFYSFQAFLINNVGWFPYVLPILIVLILCAVCVIIYDNTTNKVKKELQKIVDLTDDGVQRLNNKNGYNSISYN